MTHFVFTQNEVTLKIVSLVARIGWLTRLDSFTKGVHFAPWGQLEKMPKLIKKQLQIILEKANFLLQLISIVKSHP